jgi:cytochrome b561
MNTNDNRATAVGYSGVAKVLHWTVVILLIAQFIVAWTMPHIGRNTPVTTLISLHFTFGIIILAVAIVRFTWRLVYGEPPPPPGLPAWQRIASHIVEWLLYLLLFVIPILGWINASYRGMPIVIGGLELPKLVATRVPGWGWTGDVHGLLANYVMLALVGLHVAAALYHYFIVRDGVLQRMLPGK